jgi:predicted DNA-binding transcriptional regulator AlpA
VRVIPEHIVVTVLPDGRMRNRDAGAYLGVSVKTLCAWRMAGVGPRFRKIQGGLIFYYKQDLDQWLERHVLAQSTAELRPEPGDSALEREVQRAGGD